MGEICGGLYGGRVVGGLLVPRGVVAGHWTSRREAMELLTAGLTARVVVPAGGTSVSALVCGRGEAWVEVGPAHIAARLQGAHPDQVRCDSGWLNRLLSPERVRPIMADVHWVLTDDGTVETWVPVRAAERRSWARRAQCIC